MLSEENGLTQMVSSIYWFQKEIFFKSTFLSNKCPIQSHPLSLSTGIKIFYEYFIHKKKTAHCFAIL